jgi:hypothetical protein
MKPSIRKLGLLVLVLLIGVMVRIVWNYRHQIREFLADPFIYYQD